MKMPNKEMRIAERGGAGSFWKLGEPQVWATGAALGAILLMAGGLILIVLVNGLGFFWPAGLARLTLADGGAVLGEVTAREPAAPGRAGDRLQLKIGNRDLYGLDFRWIDLSQVRRIDHPADAVALERREHGDFFGTLAGLKTGGAAPPAGAAPSTPEALWQQFRAAHDQVMREEKGLESLNGAMTRLSAAKEVLRNRILKLRYRDKAGNAAGVAGLEAEGARIDQEFGRLSEQAGEKLAALRAREAVFKDASGREKAIALLDIVRPWRPNTMTLAGKAGFALTRLWDLLSQDPREANTEGGLFPAIFGTVLLVLLMSLFSVPLGVIAAVYLREYAREGLLVRLVRIAVGNLAGVPSIVYGVFGLGFFVYGLGGAIDRVFYPERLPAPTYGTGGLLWASMTLALLTVPVVIVATEEALAAVPRGIREGSLALGATKFQTLVRILLPMASPGIMTGLILAMARAAGEVAPLMIVGVVKLAPKLPLDGRFPFVHLDRKFMHLGFHIYDVGFQSPNVEAAKPMVFVTTLLLLLIVMAMSAVAIYLRNQMSKRYASGVF